MKASTATNSVLLYHPYYCRSNFCARAMLRKALQRQLIALFVFWFKQAADHCDARQI